MEEDIQNYLPTVMFRGTPCRIKDLTRKLSSVTKSTKKVLKKINFETIFYNVKHFR